LKEFCDVQARLADPNDTGDSSHLEDLKALLQNRMDLNRDSYSTTPLNIAWFTTMFFTIIVAVLDCILGHTDAKNCFSVSHIIVIACIVLVLVVLGGFSKWWMVKDEAGSGHLWMFLDFHRANLEERRWHSFSLDVSERTGMIHV